MGITANKVYGDALLFQLVQGTQDGIVFPHCRQYVVSRTQQSLENQIESCRRIVCKCHIVIRTGMEQAFYLLFSIQHQFISPQGIAMGSPGRIAVQAAAEHIIHSIGDGLWLLHRRRRIIKVIHRVPPEKTI